MVNSRSGEARAVKAGSRLEQLPIELLQEILSFTTSSTGVYRSLLLVSKAVNSLAKVHCLQVVPVVLEGIGKLRSFDRLLAASPKISGYVRYLWIYGEGLEEWELNESILARCSNVVALSCSSRTFKSLCSSISFSHTRCTELALRENWHIWEPITATPHRKRYCAQITHLRLSQDLGPDFPKHYFTNLTHLAFFCSPVVSHLQLYSDNLSSLRSLQLIVLTNAESRYTNPLADPLVSELFDERFAILQCPENWTEVNSWKERVRGGQSLWEQAKVGKSTQVFRDVSRVLEG